MKTHIDGLVIHCSDSTFGSVNLIKSWHTDKPPKGRGWDDTGYTMVICNGQVENNTYVPFMDGAIEWGRDIDTNGAHTRGFNEFTSICLIGKSGKFTINQLESVRKVILYLVDYAGLDPNKIYAHGDLDKKKEHCPGIDIKEFVKACIGLEVLDEFAT